MRNATRYLSDMSERKWPWWIVAAAVVGAGEVVLSIGNLVSYAQDTQRSLSSALMSATGGMVLATLVLGGIALRRRNRALGSVGVAAGVIPGSFGIAFFWFPPAVAGGILCIAITTCAVADALNGRAALRSAAPEGGAV